MISNAKLDFWLKNNYNVLLRGKHGVGKSAVVIEAFNRANLKWMYFSASTMDPWVDFVGVPKERKDANGNSYLDLIRPKKFQDDEVEALFFDEFNRCLVGDTKIQMASGENVAIKDLIGKKEFFVYSYDTNKKRIVIGRGHSARMTEKKAEIYVITLNNGEKIECTHDHPFLTSDEKYIQADQLEIGQSLMSFNKALKCKNIEKTGTEDVYDITVDDYHNFALEAGIFVHNSQKKIRNAVMELIQFKSINGKKFKNLKIVWAAINPEDDEDNTYDVEELDPAQIDRFHVTADIPYKPHLPYFKKKFGTEGETAVNWWRELNLQSKNLVSPRRLDYAVDLYKKGGDLRDVLGSKVSVNKLALELLAGPTTKIMNKLLADKNKEGAKKFIRAENNFAACHEKIAKDEKLINFFVPLMHEEKIGKLISKSSKVEKYIISKYDNFESLIKSISKAKTNRQLSYRLTRIIQQKDRDKLRKIRAAAIASGKSGITKNNNRFFTTWSTPQNLQKTITRLQWRWSFTQTQSRRTTYKLIEDNIPQKPSADDAEKLLYALVKIMARSQKQIITRDMKQIIPMMNHLCDVLSGQSILPAKIENFLPRRASTNGQFLIKNGFDYGPNLL